MTFDLYANINDIVDGLAFSGDMRFFVKDDDQIKAETKIRMPEKNKETKTEYPYASSYGNVIELGEGDGNDVVFARFDAADEVFLTINRQACLILAFWPAKRTKSAAFFNGRSRPGLEISKRL